MPHDILPVVSGNNLRKIWQKLLATFPTRTQVITLIEENAKLKKEVVQELPTENINTNCIYLVPDPNGTARNVYNEYMYIIDEPTQQGNWELIGTTRVDMTQYYTKTQTDRMLLDKQNRTDNDLPTESKTITGAISEIFTTLSNFISSTGTALTSLINRVTKLEPIQGTTADIMQKFNDGEIPEGYYAESWDDDVAEFALETTSDQYGALTEAQQKAFNYLITDGLPGGMLLMDNYPREGSNNAVKSKGLYAKFKEINTHLLKLLWENPNPTNQMATDTTITLSSADYDLLLVVYTENVAYPDAQFSEIVSKGKQIKLTTNVAFTNGIDARSRVLTPESATTLKSNQAVHGVIPSGSVGNDNGACVPYAIYGVKVN